MIRGDNDTMFVGDKLGPECVIKGVVIFHIITARLKIRHKQQLVLTPSDLWEEAVKNQKLTEQAAMSFVNLNCARQTDQSESKWGMLVK